MNEKKAKNKVLLPSAMMAVVGMLLGAAVGPVATTGAILGSPGPETSRTTSGQQDVLLDAIEGPLLLALSAGPQCPKEVNDDNPIGREAGSCTFACPGPAGIGKVRVDADDPDAYVSGTGSCGPYDAHCSDRDSCGGSVSYHDTQAGACSGESDEAWNNGFYLNCYANTEDDPKEPQDPDICVVEEPMRVCIDPSGVNMRSHPTLGAFAHACPGGCEIDVADGTVRVSWDHDGPGITIGGYAGTAVGLVCDGTGACDIVRPQVLESAGITRFII